MSWNAGGLSSSLWQELLLTLEQQSPETRPQIVCIQETHWGDQVAPSFITAHWAVHASPTSDNKAAGLLFSLTSVPCLAVKCSLLIPNREGYNICA